MMKLLVMGDLHAADKPPLGRIDNYMETVLRKLGAIADLAREHDVAAVLSTGDIFHSKQSNRVSDTLRQRLIASFNSFPCQTYVVPGNHDYGPAGLESLSSQPLGTLEEAGAVTVLREITDSRLGVWIVPRPYNAVAEGFHTGTTDPLYYSLTEREQDIIANGQPGAPVIGIAHGSILPPGDTRQYPYVNVDDIPGIEHYNVYICGHIHEPLGIHWVGNTIFANPGSVMRTSRDLTNYARQVQVLLVEVGDGGLLSVTEVPIPGMAPALEVFGRRPETHKPDANSDEITNFIELLGEGIRADTLTIPELLAELGEKIEPRVKAEVQRYLEEASS